MSMSAYDLPPKARAAMLQHIRSQIGDAQYERLLAAIGEYDLIDQYIHQLGAAEPRQAVPSGPPSPSRAKVLGTSLLMALLFPLFWMSGNWFNGVLGFVMSVVSLVFWGVIWAMSREGTNFLAGVIAYVVLTVVFALFLAANARTR